MSAKEATFAYHLTVNNISFKTSGKFIFGDNQMRVYYNKCNNNRNN